LKKEALTGSQNSVTVTMSIVSCGSEVWTVA